MTISETFLKGCYIIQPNVYDDERGSFFESYKKDFFEKSIGNEIDFVQENHSISKKWVLRGLHFQKGKYSQSKMVSVSCGEVLDIVVDIRVDSPTFGKHFKIKLSSENRTMLFIPKGFAHGFLSLAENTIFQYKCDTYYNKNSECGIIYNDLDLNIDWEFPTAKFILSNKDKELPIFKNLIS